MTPHGLVLSVMPTIFQVSVLLLLLTFNVTFSSSITGTRRNALNTAHPHAVQRAEVRPEDEHLTLKISISVDIIAQILLVLTRILFCLLVCLDWIGFCTCTTTGISAFALLDKTVFRIHSNLLLPVRWTVMFTPRLRLACFRACRILAYIAPYPSKGFWKR